MAYGCDDFGFGSGGGGEPIQLLKTCNYYVVPGHDIEETECGNKILDEILWNKGKEFKFCPYCGGEIKRIRDTKSNYIKKQYELF